MAVASKSDARTDLEVLGQLNRDFVRSVDEADVRWFEQHLAADFFNTNPDGSFVDRAGFLAQIARGSAVRDIKEHDVKIRLLGDYAIIHACTRYRKPGWHGWHGTLHR